MAVRYFRNASNVLVSVTERDSLTPPTGQTAVSKADIRAVHTGVILLGDTFDGTTYTSQSGQRVSYNPAVALDLMKLTALSVHEQFFTSLYPRIKAVADGHRKSLGDLVLDLILGQVEAVYVTMSASAVSHALRTSYIRNAILGPSEITGHSTPRGVELLFETAAGLTLPAGFTPGDSISFLALNSDGDAYERRAMQASVNASATDFRTDTTDFGSVHLADPSWIHDLT